MTRDEMFASLQHAIHDDMMETADDFGHTDAAVDQCIFAAEVLAAHNLSEIAKVCQAAEWELGTFIRFVLAHSGWNHDDIMFPLEWED